MAKANNKPKVKRIFNLLRPIDPPKTAWDKVYEWLLGKAKIVIIVSQVIIALAFFAKIVVDTTAKRKEKEIAELENQLLFYQAQYEPGFRKLQLKDTEYAKLWNQSSSYASIVQEVYSYLENPNAEITVTIRGNEVRIFGNDDLGYLDSLELSMKSSQSFVTAKVRELSQEQRDIIENRARYDVVGVINLEKFKRSFL